MYRAFTTAVTGLQANQTRMEVIGNNIANVNTTAFKANRATFEELFAQTIRGAGEPTGNRGGTNAMQIGLGAQVLSIDTIHSQGALQTTGKNTDIAIQGKGFFVLKDSQGARLFTRDGNFSLDAQRRLVTNNGLLVQGYGADNKGTIKENDPIGNIVIEANRTYPPRATTKVSVAGNIYRTSRLKADEAYAHSQQNRVGSGVVVTGFGNAAGQIQLGTANPNVLDAGELTINGVSITGDVGLIANLDTTTTVMQKISDLINFNKEKTNVVATVKQAASAVGGEEQIVLTHLQPGSDQQIVIGGSGLAGITLNGSQIFNAGTTTIETQSNNTTGQAAAGSIALASGAVVINGVDIGSLAATPITSTAEQNAQSIISLINSKTDTTGVTAFSDGNGRISLRATARDIIVGGQSVAAGTAATDPTPGGGVNVSGLFTGLNRAKTASVIAATTTDVFDSLGAKHTVNLNFVSDYDVVTDVNGIVSGTRDAGIWNWAATAGEADIAVLSTDGSTINSNVPLRQVRFNDEGVLSTFSGRFTLNFLNSDAVTANSIFAFNTNLSPSIKQPQPMTIDVGTAGDTNGLTQFSGPRTLTVATQDGYAAGDLSSFTISPDGTIRGLFSNGQLLALGKLAIASFVNESGLSRGQQGSGQGGNVYQETPNSGAARIGTAQAAGNGSIIGGTLEGSNVSLAEQFTDMIVTQRAFQANSRTISSADEMLQEVLNLKR
jgi:flagellar hook protein FlgE